MHIIIYYTYIIIYFEAFCKGFGEIIDKNEKKPLSRRGNHALIAAINNKLSNYDIWQCYGVILTQRAFSE